MDRRTIHFAAAIGVLVVSVVMALGVKTTRTCPTPYMPNGPGSCVQMLQGSLSVNPDTGLLESEGGGFRYAEPYVDRRLPLRATYLGAGLVLAFILFATANAPSGPRAAGWSPPPRPPLEQGPPQ